MTEILFRAPVLGEIGLRIEPPHWRSRNGSKAGISVFVEIDAGSRSDRLLRIFLQSRKKRFLCPFPFGGRRVAVVECVTRWVLGYGARAFVACFFSRHESPILACLWCSRDYGS